MAGRDPRRDQINAAAAALIETLATDREFVALIAEPEIERQVAAGDLIRAETLMVAPGLELVPIGVREALRAHLQEIAEHPEVVSIEALADLRDRCGRLLVGGEAPGPAESSGGDPAGQAPPPTDDEEPQPEVEVEDDDREKRRKPEGMPTGPQPCNREGCDVVVDEKQARLSWIRHNKTVFCVDHHKEQVANKAAA